MAKVSPLRSRLRLRRRAKKPRKSSSSTGRWSAAVTQRSNALDLERNVFVGNSPSGIARSLKRSAERTRRRKTAPIAPQCPCSHSALGGIGRIPKSVVF